MEPIKKGLDGVLRGASVALFALLVVVVVWQVFTRQVLNSPSAWTEELARYTFVWVGLFATALVFSERGHIAVDFVVTKFSAPVQKAVAVVVQLSIILFAGAVLIYGGIRASRGAWGQSLSALPTQVGVMYLVMPITGVLIAFYAVYHLLAVLRGVEAAIEVDDNPQVV
ncbi:TRAP transporter small permease [Ornithinicoccus hortensis]|uniref:TRAP-type C4-dicarboxylate transport system permease small subunit n=1 Tax=Ornithinicoccus hortensis TaxID=82346 RepID=A0A542YNP2_9MICO|nr:TRAP transporter small permease [Ornithinicoccus hortensis]TQL49718.1 TRAP-type C4-dicarboxylate transport system permease small subunit [Ornithinicoccus hortensis]